LIQAASRLLSGPIDYKSKIVAIYPETTLKDVLVIFYKKKLKWVPVINENNYVKGVVSRIDVLNFIATHSDL
jgi:CBS domain-containing protein